MRKKKAKEAKNYTQALWELKCAYTKKKWLKFRIKQSITRGILNSRAKGIEYFGPLKTKWKFPYICPSVGQTEEILTSSVIWMYVYITVKQKHVIETVMKKAVFITVHNLMCLEFDNIFKF